MTRKIAIISLIFCLVVPLLATYTYFHYQKKVIRKSIKHQIIAGINREELMLLKFSKSDAEQKLRWEHSREFEYDGHMFDVVERSVIGDTTYFWCWPDSKETKLNRALDGLLTQLLGNNQERQQKQDKLAEFYKKLYQSSHTNQPEYFLQSSQQKVPYLMRLTVMCFSPAVPPPRMS